MFLKNKTCTNVLGILAIVKMWSISINEVEKLLNC